MVKLGSYGSCGGSEYLLAGGFLPGHPVHLTVDGQAVATLTATPLLPAGPRAVHQRGRSNGRGIGRQPGSG